MAMSKTQQALAYLRENPDRSVYAAAKANGITPTTLYTAIAREKSRGRDRCPCCGQVVRDGFEVNHSVLKTTT